MQSKRWRNYRTEYRNEIKVDKKELDTAEAWKRRNMIPKSDDAGKILRINNTNLKHKKIKYYFADEVEHSADVESENKQKRNDKNRQKKTAREETELILEEAKVVKDNRIAMLEQTIKSLLLHIANTSADARTKIIILDADVKETEITSLIIINSSGKELFKMSDANDSIYNHCVEIQQILNNAKTVLYYQGFNSAILEALKQIGFVFNTRDLAREATFKLNAGYGVNIVHGLEKYKPYTINRILKSYGIQYNTSTPKDRCNTLLELYNKIK